ncbi:hypothetical protein ACE1CI_37650 [Aerosakkonemataceae cyanobacterium BLCC-F50]|uniref:Uncharacterized protein n=1 Tax=Floridaenema flaviceps BLCC-F50 TaxID=3153642 RepID=A0ABV4Y3V1_9CYAN
MRLETLKFGSELEVKDSDIFIDYNNFSNSALAQEWQGYLNRANRIDALGQLWQL